MTVLDANNNLFEWFKEHDTFEINRDLRKIVPIMEDEEETNIAFKLALEDLTEQNLIASKDYGDKKYYILLKPFDAYNQNIDLSSWTCKFVASEVNEFCELIQDNTDIVSVTNILEKDVRNLVHLVQYYKNKMIEKEGIISNLSLEDLDEISNDNDDDDDDDDHNEKKKKKKK